MNEFEKIIINLEKKLYKSMFVEHNIATEDIQELQKRVQTLNRKLILLIKEGDKK